MKTAMIIAIETNGNRIVNEMSYLPGRGMWDKAIKAVGQKLVDADIERLVIIDGTDVYDYGYSEVREVLFLEG